MGRAAGVYGVARSDDSSTSGDVVLFTVSRAGRLDDGCSHSTRTARRSHGSPARSRAATAFRTATEGGSQAKSSDTPHTAAMAGFDATFYALMVVVVALASYVALLVARRPRKPKTVAAASSDFLATAPPVLVVFASTMGTSRTLAARLRDALAAAGRKRGAGAETVPAEPFRRRRQHYRGARRRRERPPRRARVPGTALRGARLRVDGLRPVGLLHRGQDLREDAAAPRSVARRVRSARRHDGRLRSARGAARHLCPWGGVAADARGRDVDIPRRSRGDAAAARRGRVRLESRRRERRRPRADAARGRRPQTPRTSADTLVEFEAGRGDDAAAATTRLFRGALAATTTTRGSFSGALAATTPRPETPAGHAAGARRGEPPKRRRAGTRPGSGASSRRSRSPRSAPRPPRGARGRPRPRARSRTTTRTRPPKRT